MAFKQHNQNEAFPLEMAAMFDTCAQKYHVASSIHPNDFIFLFLLNNPCFPGPKEAVEYYFRDGAQSANHLSNILYNDLKLMRNKSLKLLEFASGYGCVTRHLAKELPSATITPCDIHDDAISFISNHLGLKALLSEKIPEHLKLEQEYDVVFALSFFSHMPESTWGRWIKALSQGLKKNGFLIFTTHGKESATKHFGNPVIPGNGFWFSPHSEQKDLDNQEYGQTIVTPDFVVGELYRQIQAPLVIYRCGFWWNHQDLYVVQKTMPLPE